jgi:hypothetical protein
MEPIIIVSAFGRGLWLAKALKLKGIEVHYIDQTPFLGAWTLEDQQGPFAFFKSNEITDEMFQFWQSQHQSAEQVEGFSVLTQQGPIEFRSSHLPHRLDRLQIDPAIFQVILSQLQTQYRHFQNFNLQQVWPLCLAHYFSSQLEGTPLESLVHPHLLPIMASCYHGDLLPYRQRLSEMEKIFNLRSDLKLLDISFGDKGKITGILFNQERSELIKCSRVIWGLSSAETKYLSPKVSDKIFAGQVKLHYRTWVRWSFQIQADYLPDYFMMLTDVELPWSHENFLLFKRDYLSQSYSVWCLVPASQRLHRAYLEEMGKQIQQHIENRLKNCTTKILRPPTELECLDQQQSEKVSLPIYGTYKEGLLFQDLRRIKNEFYSLMMDHQVLMDPASTLLVEKNIFQEVMRSWERELEQIKKKEMKNL